MVLTGVTRIKSWAAVLGVVVAACAILAARKKAASPAPPEEFSAFIGGFPGHYIHVDLKGDKLTYRYSENGVQGTDQVTVLSPGPEDWRRFNAAMNAAGVLGWKRVYDNPSLDGTRWGLKLRYAQGAIESEGHNAFPSEAKFNAYKGGVRALVGGKIFD